LGGSSRAVRVPTRIERDVAIDVTDPAGNPVARLLGNPNFHAEQLLAYELGADRTVKIVRRWRVK
jgi:hypothetical protein